MTKFHITIILFLSISYYADADENFTLTQQCLTCICEAISSCDTGSTCTGKVCGPFRITLLYWADSDRPTVNGESSESPTAFKNCAFDTKCSALTVEGYMRNFRQDCNDDGLIDCDDFAAIHKLGGYGCKGKSLLGTYARKYYECKDALGATCV